MADGPGMEMPPRLLASIMYPHPVRAALAASLALAAPLALADVYTWKDASGRLNVSNIAPPDGVHVESVVHEDPPKPSPSAIAARTADVQALTERVAQLQDDLERSKQQPALPQVVYQPAPSAPPVQVTVNVIPSAPASVPAYAPAYAPPYPVYSGYPYPGYPGLPYDYCDPTIFGCPFLGYPVGGIVVLNSPHSHGMKHFSRMRGTPPPSGMRPMPMPMPVRGSFAR